MSRPAKKVAKKKVGKPRRDPSGTVRQLSLKVTPTVYDFYLRRGDGNAGRAARETLEREAASRPA